MIFKIFSFLIIHTRDRTPSITRLHTETRNYFNQSLVDHFIRSPKVVVEEIMTDISDLLQKFWTTSNGAVEASFFAMRSSCLLGILQICFDSLVDDDMVNDDMVCFDIIPFFATAVDLELITLQISKHTFSWHYCDQSHDAVLRDKFAYTHPFIPRRHPYTCPGHPYRPSSLHSARWSNLGRSSSEGYHVP